MNETAPETVDTDSLSAEQKLGLALVSLLTPAVGYAMGGKEGAMAGAQHGFMAAGGAAGDMAKDQSKKREASAAEKKVEEKYNRERKDRKEDAIEIDKAKQEHKPDPTPPRRNVQRNAKGQLIDVDSKEVIDASMTPEKPKATPGDKAASDVAKSFEGDFAKKTQIASVIDRELEKFKQLMDEGKEEEARRHGEGMLKALNSAFGADAVGAEEAERLGGFLKPFKKPWEPGSMFSSDLDLFYNQVAGKSEALKGAAADSLSRAKTARSGGIDALAQPPAPAVPPDLQAAAKAELERRQKAKQQAGGGK